MTRQTWSHLPIILGEGRNRFRNRNRKADKLPDLAFAGNARRGFPAPYVWFIMCGFDKFQFDNLEVCDDERYY